MIIFASLDGVPMDPVLFLGQPSELSSFYALKFIVETFVLSEVTNITKEMSNNHNWAPASGSEKKQSHCVDNYKVPRIKYVPLRQHRPER